MATKKKAPPNQPLAQAIPQSITTPPTAIAPPAVLSASSSYAGITIKPVAYDPDIAKAALDASRDRLAAFSPDALSVPRLDVHAAALAALAVHALVTQVPSLHTRFEKLHMIEEFDLKNLDYLKDVAFIVLYTQAQAESAGAFQSNAKVPIELIKEGMEIESRMQELCEYKFKRDPEISLQLALLRPGTGYRDLAGDLLGYADIYTARAAEVASDTTNYRASDVTDARRVAGEILSHLSAAMSPKARDAYDLLVRSFTLLLEVYKEVQEVGRNLLRYDPSRNERFPSLYAVGRSSKARKTREMPEAAEGSSAAEQK